MKMELYLQDITQEMIDYGRSKSQLEMDGEVSWVVSWPKSCCVLDFSKPGFDDIIHDPLRGFVLREEKEGGMMWDPRTGAVYKLDEEAYHTLLELDHGYSGREVARHLNLSVAEVRNLEEKLVDLLPQ